MAVLDVDLTAIRWSDWWQDPYPLYRVLRDEHPVLYDDANSMFVVTRYEDVWGILGDAKRFSNAARYLLDHPEALISPLREADPPLHTFLRRIVMPMFTPSEMRSRERYFRELARTLLDDAERSDVVEISSQIAVPLPGRVTCDLLGVPLEQHARFLELTAERLELLEVLVGRAYDRGGLRTLAEVRADLWAIVGPVVSDRRREPQHDATTLLVQAQERHGPDAVSDELIVDMLLHLLTGGFHTTQHLIEMLVSLLADRDDLWQRLRRDRTLVAPAIEEMLRFDAPVQALRRRAVDDVEIRGTTIPRDADLSLVYGSANRDERTFEDPDTFSLDRGGKRHLAFAGGIHYCPGAPVSRFEVSALIDEMLDRYEGIERAGPSERAPLDLKTVEAMHGFSAVPVRLRSDAAFR